MEIVTTEIDVGRVLLETTQKALNKLFANPRGKGGLILTAAGILVVERNVLRGFKLPKRRDT